MPDIDGIRYPNASDIPDLPGDLLKMATDVDARLDAITAARQIQTFRPADSTARNAIASANNGDLAYQQDTGVTYKRVSGAWKAWESEWVSATPTVTGITVGNGALTGKTKYSAGMLKGEGGFTLGSTSAISGPVRITFPVTTIPVSAAGDFQLGTATVLDAGVIAIPAVVSSVSSTQADVRALNAAGTWLTTTGINGSSPVAAIGSGDSIEWRYEVIPV